ncbi:unnamed protein product [Heterobilharzia americana]|nr:unnamed protein product [Heterobilharzia americana]
MPPCPNVISLPPYLLEKAFSYLTYEEVSKLRETCKYFDVVCRGVLNKGFRAIERKVVCFHSKLRSLLPRRESERRTHPLNRHCEALSAVETRLSLLKMSIMRYADKNRCCFFPGKVLDEIESVCRFIRSNQGVSIRPYDILHELRDISSMAMEHFEEKILPSLHIKSDCGSSWPPSGPSGSSIGQTYGPIPLDELRAVSAFKRHQLNQLAQKSCESSNSVNACHRKLHTTSEDLHVNRKLSSDMKYLKQRQALSMSRICKLSSMVCHLLCKQRELNEQNKRLTSLVNTQNHRIQHLESACGVNSLEGLESISSPSTPVVCVSSLSNQSFTISTEHNTAKSVGKRNRSNGDGVLCCEDELNCCLPSKILCSPDIQYDSL